MNWSNNIFQEFFKLFIVLVVFSCCRGIFLLQNAFFYDTNTLMDTLGIFAAGFKYDVAALLLINTPYIAIKTIATIKRNQSLQQLAKTLFIAVNLLAIIVNIIDIFYFAYTLDRLTFAFFDYLRTQKNLGILLYRFAGDYWYGVIFFVAFIMLIVKGYNKIEKIKSPISLAPHYKNKLIILGTALWLCGCTGSIIPFSNGLIVNQSKVETQKVFKLAAQLNTPYNMLANWLDPIKKHPIEKLEENHYTAKSDTLFQKKNIVVFILEGFTKEASGLLNPDMDNGNYKGYTPFLDSLMQKGYFFTNAYANGRRSMDAVPAILASRPVSFYDDQEKVISIASLLKNEGYTTQFYHGAHNGSMDFDIFCKKAGIDQYFGLTEYNNMNDFDGTWGIWDEPFLQYMAQCQNKTQQPFCSTVFNLSSHNPYVLPEQHNDRFKEGVAPISRCIEYADYSIKQYFETVKDMPWYENTVFVFAADHSIIPWHKSYASYDNSFAIPLFFFTPDQSLVGKSDRIAQQADIMPSLLNYLNYPKSYKAIGNDLFNSKTDQWAITEVMKVPHLIKRH
ncbi:alkaline phosphatase family protein [Prolixibacteraceae bacterium JC049]|nr:alkaline phosphatase family protein [Prolixibacteraceae bacterium JC049]